MELLSSYKPLKSAKQNPQQDQEHDEVFIWSLSVICDAAEKLTFYIKIDKTAKSQSTRLIMHLLRDTSDSFSM